MEFLRRTLVVALFCVTLSYVFISFKVMAGDYSSIDVPPVESRGIYVYASSFENPDSIRDAFELFKSFNINMIFFLVKDPWKLSADEGNVYYNSSLRPFRRGWDWDPLRVAVDEARRLGLELHAWFNVFRDPYLAKNQSLAMKYCNGEYDQEWACPANPIVRSNLLKLIEEIVAKYDVDGIHLDYIRYNNSSACYCKYCIEAYTNETGRYPPHSPLDPDWDDWTKWRIKQISSFVNETYNLVKGLKPHVKVSAYVKSRIYDAIHGVFQNWTEWVHGGYVDFLVLGAYTKDIEDFKKRVNEVLNVTEWKVPSYIGIGLHEFNETRDPESIIEQVNVTRTLGAEGQVFFRYFKPCEPKYCNLTEVLWEALKSVYQKPSLTPHTLSRNATLIFMEGGKYPIIAYSNSTLNMLHFNSSEGSVQISVSGPSGSIGYTVVRLPQKFIENVWDGKIYVRVNNTPWPFIEITCYTWTYIQVEYDHEKQLEIIIVPEFANVFMAMLTLTVIFILLKVFCGNLASNLKLSKGENLWAGKSC